MAFFGKESLKALARCHPHLQSIAQEAILETDFRVLDSIRDRDAQERAFAAGHSKVHFGNSAHNYEPAIAFDLFPAPYSWKNRKAFIDLSNIIFRIAREKNIELRWGGDFDRDGDKTTKDSWDLPHYELHPWRDWAKKSRLYKG